MKYKNKILLKNTVLHGFYTIFSYLRDVLSVSKSRHVHMLESIAHYNEELCNYTIAYLYDLPYTNDDYLIKTSLYKIQ